MSDVTYTGWMITYHTVDTRDWDAVPEGQDEPTWQERPRHELMHWSPTSDGSPDAVRVVRRYLREQFAGHRRAHLAAIDARRENLDNPDLINLQPELFVCDHEPMTLDFIIGVREETKIKLTPDGYEILSESPTLLSGPMPL